MTSVGAECQRVLRQNWREGASAGTHYAYTCPSPDRYPWQWYWDSCFAAIAWRHFEPSHSRAELETLLRAARPDGFIGHTIFWEPLRGTRTLFYNRVHPGDLMTGSIQPPLLPWAQRPWHNIQESVLLIQKHWVECLASGSTPSTSGRDNLGTYALVEASYKSAATGLPVDPRTL